MRGNGAPKGCLRDVEGDLKQFFVLCAGESSGARRQMPKKIKGLSGDGAKKWAEEKTNFWAVATPLCAAYEPPNAFGAGGRYRPSCRADLLAPSPAEL
jgi:hypothetical protein